MMSAAKREQQVGLWAAIYRGDVSSVKRLFLNGADVKDVDHLGANTNSRGTMLHSAARDGNVEMIRLVLSHDQVDIFCTDNDGRTAEDVAIYNDHFQVATILKNAKLAVVTAQARSREITNAISRKHTSQQNSFASRGNTVDMYHQNF